MLSLDVLIRSLKTHEIELNEASKESNRKGKSIALKSTQRKSSSSKAMKASKETDEEEEPSNDEDDEEKDEITHLAKKISNAWIRMKKRKASLPKIIKREKPKQNEITCYECMELGNLRSKYPKIKKNLKKKAPKKKAMMTIWEDLNKRKKGAES